MSSRLINEKIVNTVATFSKRDVVAGLIPELLEASVDSMKRKILDSLVDLIMEDLKDDGNTLQFILTIKRFDE